MPGQRSEGASRLTSYGTISWFDLPKRIRHNIYKRVLVVAHPVYLFQDKGSRVEAFAPEKPIQWLALLHSNRKICGEAIEVLYGMNRFILVDTTRQQAGFLQSFLRCIGPVNAGLLSHICINFPVLENIEDQHDKVEMGEGSLHIWRLLREKCTNLTTLETFIYGKNSSFLTEADGDNSQFVREVLLQIDAQLKAISSLKKIIIRVYSGTLTPLVIDLMQGLGWVILFGDR